MAAGVMRDRDDATDRHGGDGAGPDAARLRLSAWRAARRRSAVLPDPIGPSAAAAAFDRQAFLDAGGFDEALFAYWEDVDLVLRLRLAGGRCVLAARGLGTHVHSATLGSGSRRQERPDGLRPRLRASQVVGDARLASALA